MKDYEKPVLELIQFASKEILTESNENFEFE